MSEEKGVIYRISGPVVTAVGISPRMYEVVRVGDEGLMGEVIELHGEQSVIQVYEETSGVRPGEPVIRTGQTLSVQLGPGLLTKIYDGIQRPLPELEKTMGVFIKRGVDADGLDLKKNWNFIQNRFPSCPFLKHWSIKKKTRSDVTPETSTSGAVQSA